MDLSDFLIKYQSKKRRKEKQKPVLKTNKGKRVTNMITIEKSLPEEAKKILRRCPREKPREIR